jgi:predicted dinucleotide-utilizing enzyme
MRVEIANIPSADNPRSARLVAMSVVHALLSRGPGLRVG